MVTFATLQILHGSLLRSQFLGQDLHFPLIKTSKRNHRNLTCQPQTCAEFNILKMMGGRGLCNGEIGVEKELKRKVDQEETQPPPPPSSSSSNEKVQETSAKLTVEIPEDGFEKEMMGLTGGFPGGEKGLIKFIEENPNPPRKISQTFSVEETNNQSVVEESKTS